MKFQRTRSVADEYLSGKPTTELESVQTIDIDKNSDISLRPSTSSSRLALQRYGHFCLGYYKVKSAASEHQRN